MVTKVMSVLRAWAAELSPETAQPYWFSLFAFRTNWPYSTNQVEHSQ